MQVKNNKRYAAAPDFTVSEVAAKCEKEIGKIDILVPYTAAIFLVTILVTLGMS